MGIHKYPLAPTHEHMQNTSIFGVELLGALGHTHRRDEMTCAASDWTRMVLAVSVRIHTHVYVCTSSTVHTILREGNIHWKELPL